MSFDFVFDMDGCIKAVDSAINTEGGIVCIAVTKGEILSDKFVTIDTFIRELKKYGQRAKGKLMLTFSGYDDVPYEVFEIEEVRNYMARVFERYPFIFYFLTDLDMNNKTILACLCDVETLYVGETKQSLTDIMYSGGTAGPVHVSYSINPKLSKRIADGVVSYCLSIGETRKEAAKFVERLFDFTQKDRRIPDYKNIDICAAFEEMNRKLWLGFVKKYKLDRKVTEGDIKYFTAMNKEYIIGAIASGVLSFPIVTGPNRTSNVFIVNDLAYGPICEKCNSTFVLVIKDTFENDEEELKSLTFVPSYEIYIQNKLMPFDEQVLRHIHVPINHERDKWFCPICEKVHSFEYGQESGLSY